MCEGYIALSTHIQVDQIPPSYHPENDTQSVIATSIFFAKTGWI